MDAATATIITACMTAIAGPILIHFIKQRSDNQHYPNAGKQRLSKLTSTQWKGHFYQPHLENPSELVKTDIQFTLKSKNRLILGHVEWIGVLVPGEITKLKINKGVFDGTILKLDYENEDKGIFQMGSAILELDAYGSELVGVYVGYSPLTRTIISGKVVAQSN